MRQQDRRQVSWLRAVRATKRRLSSAGGGVLFTLVGLFLLGALSEDNRQIFPQLLANSLITGSLYALVTSGLALTYGILRVMNFAHGHLLMVGAYLFWWLSMEKGVGGLPSAVLTGGLSLLLGAVCYAVFFAPFLQRSSLLSIVSTLALGTILESAVSMLFGVNVRSLDGGAGAESLELGGVFITQLQIAIIITALLLLGGVAFLIHSTRAGRMLRMLSEHPFAAESLGVGMKKTSVWVFLLSMLLTVYAGVMIGFETNLQPTMGQSYTIKPFAAMVLGGTGNVWGAVAGAYLLGLIENLSIGLDLGAFSLPAGYKDAFAYLFILLVLLFKPEGIFRPRARRA